MKKKHVLIVLLLVLSAAFVFGAGQKEAAPAGGDKKVEIKISHVLPTNEPIHEVLVEMAEAIKSRSKGSIDVQVYPNSQLGNNKDNLEQARRGANILTIADPGYVADYVPDYSIMNGPFLYKHYKDFQKLAASSWHKEMEKQSSEKGLKILAMDWYFGARYVISGKVIKTPDDMKGMKVRVPPNKVWIETIKAMGGSPTVLQWSEVYSGLAQGVVDAAEAPLSTLFGSKLYESRKNIALTGHFKAIVGLQMSQKYFDSMSKEQQEILTDEVKKHGIKATERVANTEAEWRKKLEAQGVVFNEVDVAAFEKACVPFYSQFSEWSPGLYDKVRKAIAE
jgi:tripartite ATP-independent transporter DctP family solute receptor